MIDEPAPSRREERRLHRHGLGREQLLDAAEQVFGRKGYHDATLKEVAELAEFSVGSVYSFFDNKDDLFRQLFHRRGEQFMAGMRDVLADLKERPDAQLRRLVAVQVGFFRDHPDFARLVLRYSNLAAMELGDVIDGTVADNYAEATRLQAALFERGQRVRVFRRGDPKRLSGLLSGLVFAYQAGDAEEGGRRLPLDDFHDLVLAAFRR